LSTSSKPNGFSLVELAVVMTIIGLLIAGIMKGGEMMDNARVGQTVMQFKKFETATRSFKSMYGDLPGDISSPSRLPDCTASPCTLAGDGNGVIGTSQHTDGDENRAYWMHLTKAGLISGIDAKYTGTPNQWGKDFPRNPINGGWFVLYISAATPYYGTLTDHFLETQYSPTASWFALSAKQVAKIDRKMDDGLPDSGNVLGLGNVNGCAASSTNLTYPETDNSKKCDAMFRLKL